MLKHKFAKVAAVVMAAAGLFLSGCKSAPVETPVDPVELLDDDGAIYLTVPVQPNQDFVNEAIVRIAGCELNDAKKISDRLEDLYICISSSGKVQLAATGNFPAGLIRLALTERKGWKRSEFLSYSYYSNMNSAYQLSLPSSKVACVSSQVENMLEKFDEIAKNDLHTVEMNQQIYSFLKTENKKDINVFAPVPKAFIKSFIGANVNAPVETINGVFSKIGNGNEFGLKIVLEMTDPRTVKAACAALKIALFPIPAKIVQTGTKQITVTDITLGYTDLLRFLR